MTKGDYIVPAWVKPDQPPPKDVPQPLKTFTETIVLKNKTGLKVPATYILTVEAGKKTQDEEFWTPAPRAEDGRRPGAPIIAHHQTPYAAAGAFLAGLCGRRVSGALRQL